MTATFDATTDTNDCNAPSARMDTATVARFAMRTAGVVLVLAAIGVWLEPTAHAGPDLLVMKLAVSLFLSLAGFMILQDRRVQESPDVEIDTVRREVRVIARNVRDRKLVRRIAIRDLGKAEMLGDRVVLKAANGDMLADVSLADARVRSSLCHALQDAGKL
ncbi:hypothetical protein [Tateyamaria sp. ANG-S1]|uniref:hypothetical protein n=1 Tax=Tateyamaria sp. ANG-S1 TaxID=1577905 RepID=UPI00057D4398|nr:hypothetical protein [Tateyamaria sp. ANG-S1]KIC49120.1 hypothetical protein RA29_16025 [Tateyamaria sp. ANG-S1]